MNKLFFSAISILSFFLTTSLKAEINLVEGHYESSGLYCAYNIAFTGTEYVAEGDHSSRLSCRDAGVVFVFESDGEGRFVHNFGSTLYEWSIVSSTSFVERVKVLQGGTWRLTNTIMFRLTSDALPDYAANGLSL